MKSNGEKNKINIIIDLLLIRQVSKLINEIPHINNGLFQIQTGTHPFHEMSWSEKIVHINLF